MASVIRVHDDCLDKNRLHRSTRLLGRTRVLYTWHKSIDIGLQMEACGVSASIPIPDLLSGPFL